MKRIMPVALALVIILVCVGSVHARGRGGGGHHGGFHHGGRGHVFVGVGPLFWDPYWYGYYPPPYAPPVVVEEPPVYVQQAPAAHGTWYYCTSARAYYPAVASCREAWVPVPARPN
jgi:hypothetical protein